MSVEIQKIIHDKLSECISSNLKIHTIDQDNSVLELDYVTISKFILDGIKDSGYEIVRIKND
jgi:hypothetical protein